MWSDVCVCGPDRVTSGHSDPGTLFDGNSETKQVSPPPPPPDVSGFLHPQHRRLREGKTAAEAKTHDGTNKHSLYMKNTLFLITLSPALESR